MTYLCNGREKNGRYSLIEFRGDCLEGEGLYIPDGGYAIIDSNAEIRVGDFVHCSRITGPVFTYVKQVKEIKGNSVIVGTCYLDKSKDFAFEAAEILGVVKEIYCKITGKRKYVRSKNETEKGR